MENKENLMRVRKYKFPGARVLYVRILSRPNTRMELTCNL